MPIQPCPNCGQPVRRQLESSHQWAHLNYYACDHCGHIWTISKDGKGRVTHITPLPDKPKGD